MNRSWATAKEIEIEPDAWARFERAVDIVAKSPPQHRGKAKPKTAKSPGKRKSVKKPR
jgi:hypothetical protein